MAATLETSTEWEAIQSPAPSTEGFDTEFLKLLAHDDGVIAEVSSAKVEGTTTFFVKMKNGIAHIVGYFGESLVYIETRVGEASSYSKVWVLGYVDGGRQHLKTSLEPWMFRLSNRLAPVTAKVKAASDIAGAKVLNLTQPIYAKMVDGVLHIQATVGNATVFIQKKVSNTWSKVSAQISCSYTMAYAAVNARVSPLWLWTSRKLNEANGAILSATQPHWVRTRDGALYIQAAIANILVRIKVASNERVLVPAWSAYATMSRAVNECTAALLVKIVSVYDDATVQLRQLLAPCLDKGQSMATYARTMVNNMNVELKVRTSTQFQRAQDSLCVCYVKIKNGYVYMHGVVGDKVLYVKVSLTELSHPFTSKVIDLSKYAQTKTIAAKDSIQDTAISAIQTAKTKASILSSKASVMVTDKKVQVTAVGAVGGAATGLATGSIAGAVCGIVPAFFTFGLSIPVFATVGGAAGLCTGTVAGGATARSLFHHKDDINNGLVGVMGKANGGKEYIISTANGGKEYVSKKAKGCADFVGERTMMVKARLVGGTGGSAADSESD